MSLASEFDRFHAQNPQVYDALVGLTRDWLRETGSTHGSIDLFFSVARYNWGITTHGDPEYKLNDHHRAFYARLIMWRERDLRGVFRMKPSEADPWISEIIAREDGAA